MMNVLGRARVWASLLIAGFVGLLVVGIVRGDRRSGFVQGLHTALLVLCLAFAVGVVVACAGRAARRRTPGDVVVAVLVVLGVAAMIAAEVIVRQEGPDSADFGPGGLLIAGFVVTVTAGLARGPGEAGRR